jgi:sortase A
MIRRTLRALGTALMIAGVVLVLDAGLTVVWQEPFSALYAKVVQSGLNKQLNTLDATAPGKLEQAAVLALHQRQQRVALLARLQRRQVKPGDPIAKITIPKISVSKAVINGTNTADLRKGPGLIESTDLPGLGTTTAIAGHRTTYGAPFNKINQLGPNDPIFVQTAYGRFEYRVVRTRIVKPTDTWVLDNVGHGQLVLSACHPLYSASHRIIIFAREVGYTPPATGPYAKLLRKVG